MMDDGLSDEQGEGYFASVSDLMVGVLFVFLLMMTVFALNFRDDSAKLDEAIARQQKAEHDADIAKQNAEIQQQEAKRLQKQAEQLQDEEAKLRQQNEKLKDRLTEAAAALERELQDREKIRAGLLQRLATRLESDGIKFALDQQSGVLRLSDSVPFATGRSDLGDPAARHTVEVLAKVLADVLPCFASVADHPACHSGDGPILETVLVEGHTDSQPFPSMTVQQSQAENDRLSTARALTVFATIRQQQPTLETLRNPGGQPLLGVSGYGQRRPLPGPALPADADLTRNRRIDLRFVLSARTSDELQKLLAEISKIQSQDTP